MNITTQTIRNNTSITIPSSISEPTGALTIQEDSDKFQLIRYFFDTVNDDTVNYTSQITDNWVENNTSIQDHIAISPVTVTMSGLCGEFVYKTEQAELDYQSELAQANYRNSLPLELANFGEWGTIDDVEGKLTAISAYFPSLSNITQKAQNIYDLHQAANKKARRIANILTGQGNNNLSSQMNAYSGLSSNARKSVLKEVGENLKDAWMNRKSFIVNTPFGDFDNMYIQSITLHQGNELYSGDISITLKQIRFAETITTKADENVLAKYNQIAQAGEESYGNSQGENKSILASMWDARYK